MKKITLLLFCGMAALCANAQKMTAEEYVAKHKDLAIAEMKRSGVPASITLAQGILETEAGNSVLVQKSNNHFGIKCKSNWTGETVSHDDDAKGECFRKYPSVEDSYKDHSDFLRNSTRYASLFQLKPEDYKGWAQGLKSAGYATNPRYPQILISNIERYNLQQFDLSEATIIESNLASATPTVEPPVMAATPAPAATSTQPTSGSKFNGIKAVFAKKGTSLLALATNNGIKLSKLMAYNELEKDGLLDADQWIYLEEKKSQGYKDEYVTVEQQSLRDVAQAHGVQMQALMKYNGFAANTILPKGTKIKLKG